MNCRRYDSWSYFIFLIYKTILNIYTKYKKCFRITLVLEAQKTVSKPQSLSYNIGNNIVVGATTQATNAYVWILSKAQFKIIYDACISRDHYQLSNCALRTNTSSIFNQINNKSMNVDHKQVRRRQNTDITECGFQR